MPDSQRYVLDLYLINNVKDIVVFLARKLLNSREISTIIFFHFHPKIDRHMIDIHTDIQIAR